jgi:hypothetical protein
VGGVVGLAFQGAADDFFDLGIAERTRRARTWLVGQTFQAIFDKTGPPLADG